MDYCLSKRLHQGYILRAVIISRRVAVMEHDEIHGISADRAGIFVAKKALQKRTPLHCTLGRKYEFFVFLNGVLPSKSVADIVGRIYAS